MWTSGALLGHRDVTTTMIYTHVLNRGGLGVMSPAEANRWLRPVPGRGNRVLDGSVYRQGRPAEIGVRRQGDIMTVKRMDNVGIVVEDIDAAIEFFTELGLTLEGRMPIEGEWAGRALR